LLERRACPESVRVVDQDVDAAPPVHGERNHALDVGPPADVRGDRERLATGAADLLCRALAAVGPQLRDAEARALAGEERRDAACAGLARTGDDRDLAVDAHVVSLHGGRAGDKGDGWGDLPTARSPSRPVTRSDRPSLVKRPLPVLDAPSSMTKPVVLALLL